MDLEFECCSNGMFSLQHRFLALTIPYQFSMLITNILLPTLRMPLSLFPIDVVRVGGPAPAGFHSVSILEYVQVHACVLLAKSRDFGIAVRFLLLRKLRAALDSSVPAASSDRYEYI